MSVWVGLDFRLVELVLRLVLIGETVGLDKFFPVTFRRCSRNVGVMRGGRHSALWLSTAARRSEQVHADCDEAQREAVHILLNALVVLLQMC